MSPRELLAHVDLLRVLFGVAILVTYLKPPSTTFSKRWFWFAIAALLLIGAVGLRPWIRHPSLDSWISAGSLFQAMFNFAVAAVLVLRYRLYIAPQGSGSRFTPAP
jgi:hypothetical protein